MLIPRENIHHYYQKSTTPTRASGSMNKNSLVITAVPVQYRIDEALKGCIQMLTIFLLFNYKQSVLSNDGAIGIIQRCGTVLP